MKKALLHTVLPIFSLLTSVQTLPNLPSKAPKTLMGTIKFPKTLSSIPMIRVYHGGRIITCTPDQMHKMLTFSIPRFNEKFQFDVLITPAVQCAVHSKDEDDNTITYLKIPINKPNKLFHVALLPKFQHDSKKNQGKMTSQWRIIEDRIDSDAYCHDGKIPDEAIIICCEPSWVELIAGTNECELPTISITPDALTRCGSQEKFHEKSTQLLLSAMDSDTVHDAYTGHAIKQEQNRIIIAAPTIG